MTTETDKLVEMARERGAFYSAARGWLTFRPDMLADFRAAIIADLAADVEQDGFHLVSVNAGFTELLEALDRADRKGYMPDAIYSAYEGFECRDPASTVAALKARVAELEKDAQDHLDTVQAIFDAIGYTKEYAMQWPKEKASVTFKRWFDEQMRAALTKGQP